MNKLALAILLLATPLLAQTAPKISTPTKPPSPFIIDIDDQFKIVGYEKQLLDLQKEIKTVNDRLMATEDGKKLADLQKKFTTAAQAEIVDTDRIIQRHKWNATFNFQAQQFEAK